jgi:hypothetical protein
MLVLLGCNGSSFNKINMLRPLEVSKASNIKEILIITLGINRFLNGENALMS